MSQTIFVDTHSPWYQVFECVAEADAGEPAPSAPADQDWTTRAVCDLYND